MADKIRLGILSPSNIAFQRFLPSLKKSKQFSYAGVAVAAEDEWFSGSNHSEIKVLLQKEKEKAETFFEKFGGRIYKGYMSLLTDDNIDAVYIPLPPSLHFCWAKSALQYRKHVLVEKPATTNARQTEDLILFAKNQDLALHENYMFQYHSQLTYIKKLIADGELGDIRCYKISFGFPLRAENDFRYSRELGGGALLDCGGYPVRLATLLLGDTAKVVYSKLSNLAGYIVDMFGTLVMENADGITAQISFGMDNAYQCSLEVWGSKQTLTAFRIFTAGTDFEPPIQLRSSTDEKHFLLPADDQFLNSISEFERCIHFKERRENNYLQILHQAKLIDQIKGMD